MLEDDIDGLIDIVSIAISQGSNILCFKNCDYFLSEGGLNRKDIFEGLNKLFAVV